MLTTQRHKTLRAAISGLQALEGQLRQQIERQLESRALESQPNARAVLAAIEPRLFAHVQDLNLRLELLQGAPSTLHQALGSVFGAAASWIEAMRSDEEVSRILRDDFAALSLALVQSQLVEVAADAIADPQTAEMLRAHRAELRQALHSIEQVLPEVLLAELQEEGKAFPDGE